MFKDNRLFVPATGVMMTRLSDYLLPMKHSVLVNFGPQLDATWIAEFAPGHLHLCGHDEDTQHLQEIWDKHLPVGHLWDCYQHIYNNTILLQSNGNEIIQYRYDNLQIIQHLNTPGTVCGFTDGGVAVVDDTASPSSATEGLRLHVTPGATNLKSYVRSLEIPPAGPYEIKDNLSASGAQGGNIAIRNHEKKYIDLYGPEGE